MLTTEEEKEVVTLSPKDETSCGPIDSPLDDEADTEHTGALPMIVLGPLLLAVIAGICCGFFAAFFISICTIIFNLIANFFWWIFGW